MKLYLELLVIIVKQVSFVFPLSCNEVLEFPNEQKVTLNSLKAMTPKEIVQCLAHLGKDKINKPEVDFIWKTIVAFYDGVPSIPEKILSQLHWITPALTSEDYFNMTLNNIDVIQNFGLNYDLDDSILGTLAEKVREDFGEKYPSDYTFYDLTALRQILCAFNRSEIEAIHPIAYREAAIVIGKLENCNPDVMKGFALLAIHKDAFGPADGWDKEVKKILGKVADFVQKVNVNQYIPNPQNITVSNITKQVDTN